MGKAMLKPSHDVSSSCAAPSLGDGPFDGGGLCQSEMHFKHSCNGYETNWRLLIAARPDKAVSMNTTPDTHRE
jgi:hypothetical protein